MKRIKTSGAPLARGAIVFDLLTVAHNVSAGEDDDESVDVYQSAAYKDAIRDLHSLDTLETPYGTLMENFVFVEDEPTAEGNFPTIEYINPSALMSHLAKVSKTVLRFFRQTRHNSSNIFVCRRGVSWSCQ